MDAPRDRDPIPEFETLEDIADFWDSHSTADYDDLTHDVQFRVQLHKYNGQQSSIALLPELAKTIQELARIRGISTETLVNVWLTEKVLDLM